MVDPQEVLEFWFIQHGREDWFASSTAFDALVAARFAATHDALARGDGFGWRTNAHGRLAEIVVLDQFSRQLHRGTAGAFAQDGKSLALAQEMVAQGLDQTLPEPQRAFVYMPYMHAESVKVHAEAQRLFGALEDQSWLEFEQGHAACIARFGRYPFRNAALGRETTDQERAYMAERQDLGF